jgi:hypothetical protein
MAVVLQQHAFCIIGGLMDKKWEIHKRLDRKFGEEDKDSQYKFLNRLVGKSHVAQLNDSECNMVLRKLNRNRIVPDYIWDRVQKT